MAHIDKVIIASDSGLAKKYGAAGKSVIDAAVSRLIAADATRGLDTQYIAVDGAGMSALGGTPVTAVGATERDYKDAVDAIYLAHTPDYIAILGAPDVFPHQTLQNPLYSPTKDRDPDIPSDLPYACAAPYSVDAANFFAPDRVVSRIPDVLGASNPAYLVTVLDMAALASTPPAGTYSSFLGISANIWKDSTNSSLTTAFGSATGMQVSPSDGAAWSPAQWSARSHFINCHGAKVDFKFYGSDASNTNRMYAAHLANLVATDAQPGTIVAAECCYGAELYDPSPYGIHQGIANTYLERGAFGFLGSTNIAYGELGTTGYADLICAYFFRHVLAGSSLGAATLAARKEFVQLHSRLDPLALKTLAQFLLLGDPSIHAVQQAQPSLATPLIAMSAGPASALASSSELRAERRKRASADARVLESTTIVSKGAGNEASPDIAQKLPEFVKSDRTSIFTFSAWQPRGDATESLSSALAEPTLFHVALTSHGRADEAPDGITRTTVRVATEVGGIITNVTTAYAR